jgi:hypothetical protein
LDNVQYTSISIILQTLDNIQHVSKIPQTLGNIKYTGGGHVYQIYLKHWTMPEIYYTSETGECPTYINHSSDIRQFETYIKYASDI